MAALTRFPSLGQRQRPSAPTAQVLATALRTCPAHSLPSISPVPRGNMLVKQIQESHFQYLRGSGRAGKRSAVQRRAMHPLACRPDTPRAGHPNAPPAHPPARLAACLPAAALTPTAIAAPGIEVKLPGEVVADEEHRQLQVVHNPAAGRSGPSYAGRASRAAVAAAESQHPAEPSR